MSDSPTRAKDPKIVGESQKVFGFIKGISLILAAVFLLSISTKACDKTKTGENPTTTPRATYQQQLQTPEFPTSGKGFATTEVGLKAYLDPMKTYTRPSGPAVYIFVEDNSIFFIDAEGPHVDTTPSHKVWLEMPPGKYLVYPLKKGTGRIYFRWWQ